VDLRHRTAFAAGHVGGTLNFGLDSNFATYLGWLIPWGTPLTLLGDTAYDVASAQRELVRIGIDRLQAAATGSPANWTDSELQSYPTGSFADLAQFDVVETVTTLTCVSNPVGGELISTGIWTGYRVADLLAAAGVHADADMVLSTSIDGFTAGTPVDALTDGRDALLAVGLNGQPLPIEHGYPARLVVPGLYGYVSATKWVVEMELTRFDRAEAYWTRQGWAPRGPIKTESRIDVPKGGQKVPMAPLVFGGVAWAQNRGVRAVEVRIGDGAWQPAELGASYSNETWRLWRFPWQAKSPGKHTITVRATDNTGATQTADQVGTVPDGATGWHTVNFTVAET